MFNKLERKFGKYAINNLICYLIGGYVIGYMLLVGQKMTGIDFLNYLTLEPFMVVEHHQYWRLISWVLIPPNQSVLWAIIMMIFYYQLGMVLEQSWGAFRFNLYIFGGILFTVIGAFVLYAVTAANGMIVSVGSLFSTYYINLSIFLAFATAYPDMEVRLYFLIPVKMKWMAIFYMVFIVVDLALGNWGTRVAIISSLLNFAIFFLSTRNMKRVNPKEVHRRNEFKRATTQNTTSHAPHINPTKNGISRHKCAICGKTELTHPDMQFRFCSKCNGNYEYCQDHLFTHQHKQ